MGTPLDVLRELIGGRSVAAVERSAGFAQGSLSKRLSGSTAIRADDLISVAKAAGHDPIRALVHAGMLDPQSSGEWGIQDVPDDVLYSEVARRAADRAAEGHAQAWVASRQRKQ